jgi:ferritin-like metal-binding protein YciE
MALDTLQELMIEQLQDLLSAEKQLVKALPKMAEAAQSPELQQAFEEHLAATETHVSRLEQAFGELGETARAKKCKGMEGLIEEGQEMIKEKGEPAVKDAGLIAAAQRVEHYEIAGYGTVHAMATELGLTTVAQLLEATLNEEKEADQLLTELAENSMSQETEADEAPAAGRRQPGSTSTRRSK